MRFALSDDQLAIKRSARAFLERVAPSAAVRAAMTSTSGYDEAAWRALSGELGFTSLPFAEADGGMGLSWIEVAAVMEELGRAVMPSPFFASVCLAGSAIAHAGSPSQREELLPRIAGGEIATLVQGEVAGLSTPAGRGVRVTREGAQHRLQGEASFVVDGAAAPLLVVAARAGAEGASPHGDGGISLFAVAGDAPGVRKRVQPSLDQTSRLAVISFDGVRVDASACLAGETGAPGSAGSALSRTLDIAAITLAASQVGGADRTLDLTVDYAKQRVQFGKPIGAFQAIKHQCADMLLEVEMARAAAYYGAYVAAHGGDDLAQAAAQAKAVGSEAYLRCAGQCIQLHGGIGFTWEHDAHLHFKRARLTSTLLGDAAHHRERFVRRLLETTP